MKLKKVLSLGLAVLSTLGVSSCNRFSTTNFATEDHNALYEETLGDFYDLYTEAKEIKDTDRRIALMAVAEAHLLDSAVMLPLSTNGGKYVISRSVPSTLPYSLWGNDSLRLKSMIVLNEYLESSDKNHMKFYWNNHKDDADFDYLTWAKDYLEQKGYTFKDTYSTTFSGDVESWDILATSKSVDSEVLVNTYDGLLEYNPDGELVPALAEGYEVSNDGLTYTFTIRQNVSWVDYQGRKIADVTADDFVAGFQHMMDAKGGLEYLVEGVIDNASEYINGEITDFNNVGVKALDNYTLEYKLEEQTPYFLTMLGYNVFAPMNREFYESMGGQFGSNYSITSENYKYGTDRTTIAYCGPYLISSAVKGNIYQFDKNKDYWNSKSVNLSTIKWLYNDGSEALKGYNDLKASRIDNCILNTTALEQAKADNLYNDYAYVSDTDATTFSAFYNINRAKFQNVDGSVKSSQSDYERELTNKAMQNADFRKAISFAFNRELYNAQVVGEDLALLSLRNSFTPGNFISLSNDLTIKINDLEVTFTKGTLYGDILQTALNTMGSSIIAFSRELGSSDGYDGWYDLDLAKKHFDYAIDYLSDLGYDVTRRKPIKIDYPYFVGNPTFEARANAYKKSIEDAFDDLVKVNLVKCNTADQWYYCGYYTQTGSDANYDMYDLSGWGPDYGDPSTYLDTMLPDGAGYMTKCIGLF